MRLTRLSRLALVFFLALSSALAQIPANRQGTVFIATAYNYTIDNTFQNGLGPYTFPVSLCTVHLPNNRNINPFNVNASVLIVDGLNSETVSLLSASTATGYCVIKLNTTRSHLSYQLRSGTYGLQEAINDATLLGGGTVALDSTWSGTTAMITGAAGNANVAIRDNRGGNPATYVWNGTGYIQQATGSGTVNVVGGGNLANFAIVAGGGGQALQTPFSQATLDILGNIFGTSFNASGTNGGYDAPEGNGSLLTPSVGRDQLFADSVRHHWANFLNGGTEVIVPTVPVAGITAGHALIIASNGYDIADGGSTVLTSVAGTAPITSSCAAGTCTVSAAYQGNGAKVQASTGTVSAANDLTKYDVNGNTVDDTNCSDASGTLTCSGSGGVNAPQFTGPPGTPLVEQGAESAQATTCPANVSEYLADATTHLPMFCKPSTATQDLPVWTNLALLGNHVPVAADGAGGLQAATLSGNTNTVVTGGTISGTASPLCTDANGNATTSGCPTSSLPFLAPCTPQRPSSDTKNNSSLTSIQYFATVCQISANTLITGKYTKVYYGFDFSSTTAPTWTMTLSLCTSATPGTGCTNVYVGSPIAAAATITSNSGGVSFLMQGTAAAGASVAVDTTILLPTAAAGNASLVPFGRNTLTTSTAGLATNGNLWIQIAVTFSSTTGTNSMTITQMVTE